MKKILALIMGVLIAQSSLFVSFADTSGLVRSNETQVTADGFIYTRPALTNKVVWNVTANKKVDEIPSEVTSGDLIEVKTDTALFKYQYHTVTRTDLKTSKKITLKSGINLDSMFKSGKSIFLVLENYDVLRYDANGKLTGTFKYAEDKEYYTSGGNLVIFTYTEEDITLSVVLETETKAKALGVFEDPIVYEMQNRTFVMDSNKLSEVVAGKLVKIGTADTFTATKSEVFLANGGKVTKVAGGKTQSILSFATDLYSINTVGNTLYLLDENGVLKSSDFAGKNVKVLNNYVSRITKYNNQLYATTYDEKGSLRKFVEKGKEVTIADVDANLYLVKGTRLVYVDVFGKLHYRETIEGKDLWTVDQKVFLAKDVLSKKDDLRYSQLILSNTRVYALLETGSTYKINVYDLNGKLIDQAENVSEINIQGNKVLQYVDDLGVYQMDLTTDVKTQLIKKDSSGNFDYSMGKYSVKVEDSTKDAYLQKIKVVETATQKQVFADDLVDKISLVDRNNLYIKSANLGTVIFNALTGAVVVLESEYSMDEDHIFRLTEIPGKELTFYNRSSSKLSTYNLETGVVSFKYQSSDLVDLYYGNNDSVTIIDEDGLAWHYNVATGEMIEVPIDYEEFSMPTFDEVGERIYIYDDMLLYGYYDTKTDELVYLTFE